MTLVVRVVYVKSHHKCVLWYCGVHWKFKGQQYNLITLCTVVLLGHRRWFVSTRCKGNALLWKGSGVVVPQKSLKFRASHG